MAHSKHAPAGPAEPKVGRRKFFQWLTGALGAIAVAIVGVLLTLGPALSGVFLQVQTAL